MTGRRSGGETRNSNQKISVDVSEISLKDGYEVSEHPYSTTSKSEDHSKGSTVLAYIETMRPYPSEEKTE